MGPIAGGDELRDRVCDAALACIARWGVAKTTLEDVAREAGCGRATIYRSFRGGKSEVLSAVVMREAGRLRDAVDGAIVEAGPDLEDMVVGGVVAATGFLGEHEALAYLLAREPELILPWVAFDRLGVLFDIVAEYAAPHLRPFLPDPDEAARAAEWLARVVLTYVLNPADGVDLADERAARHLLRTYVLPGLTAGVSPRLQEEACPATSS